MFTLSLLPAPQVIDITGKPEDAVATALYDAGWDEHRAIDLLLEGGDHLTAWEETGKKGKKKQKKEEDKDQDGLDDMDAFNGDRYEYIFHNFFATCSSVTKLRQIVYVLPKRHLWIKMKALEFYYSTIIFNLFLFFKVFA